MSAASLSEVLGPALRDGYAVAGLVVLGWEDAVAYAEAAERLGAPLILQAGPGCRKHTPVRVLGTMFRVLAEQATVPVVSHLDHGYVPEECIEAIDHGFTSVMYDGSRSPLAENIERTKRVVRHAQAAGVSVEGEIGQVGYADGTPSAPTDPDEARAFELETGVDALAISVGNVHLQQERAAVIDMAALRAIEAVTRVPLVLHGASGIPPRVRSQLARESKVCKFNVGTELRMAFGAALRTALAERPEAFDRIEILRATVPALRDAATESLDALLPERWDRREEQGSR